MTRSRASAVPLRLRLIAAVLALVTIALLLIGVVSALALRTYLIDRVDRHLVDIADSIDIGEMRQQPGLFLPTDYMVARVGNTGSEIYAVRDAAGYPKIPSFDRLDELRDKSVTVSSRQTTERWRILVRLQRDGTYLVVGESLAGADDAVDNLVASELIVGIGVLAVLASVGIGIVQASLRPLTEIERTAAAITAGDLTRRAPESDPNTEVGHLAEAFNAMLAHLEVAFAARAASEERMRQFVADASHELRTPLTTIKGFSELYRQGAARAPEQTAELLARIESEAARMGLLVEDL
ncbi:MAG: HAMP domain-containing histidine kinase, partial [Micromonosporaceae bacterium]|nr:HAMP domain-containing histidine kinase [Micromonosporaceae bacterium]